MDDVGKRYWDLDGPERRELLAAAAITGSRPVAELEQALEDAKEPEHEAPPASVRSA
jgi:hypothetical protein